MQLSKIRSNRKREKRAMRGLKLLSSIMAMIVVVAVAAACGIGRGTTLGSVAEDLRESSVNIRWNNLKRAMALYPDPANLVNFPLRQALVKYSERQDMVNHPYYVYLMDFEGDYIGYFVAEVMPQSTCNFLGSTEDIRSNSEGKVVVTAPSYDGVFYGGGGSSAACNSLFFFDQNTDALIGFNVPAFLFSDVPLVLDAQPQLIYPDGTVGIGGS